MTARRRWAALLLALAPRVALADVVLAGSQHIGDCLDPLGCVGLTPLDPQSRNDMFNTLVKFNLTTTTTITDVRLDGAVWPDRQQLQVHIQPLGGARVFRAGTLSGNTYTLSPSVVLPPGDYSIWVDGGCSTANGSGTFFYANCGGAGNDNDFGFASITLVSAQSSTSRMLARRRHVGDDTENDGDDNNGDYDGQFYPDPPDGAFVSETFTLDANRRLLSLSFYSLREVSSGAANTVRVEGVQVGTLSGNTSNAIAPYTIATNLLLVSGARTLRVDAADTNPGMAVNLDDFSWDDVVLTFADTVASGTPGLFNAVNTGASGLTGVLSTKAAGGTPGIDIVALNASGTALNTGYTGLVTVQLMDASVDGAVDAFSGCHLTWTAVAGYSTSVQFTAESAGRVALPAPFFSTALRKAALRMTDTATGAVACSTDRFALRPDHFRVTASQGSETTPGTSALGNTGTGGAPRHKAGRPFRIGAVAVDAADAALAAYDGTLDTTHTTAALAPATVDGTVTTGGWVASGASRTTDEARYDEVGAFTLTLKDSTFAAVDAGDSTDAQRHITGTADIGRFIPDHFEFAYDSGVDARFRPACSAAFTYSGQPFVYDVVPTGTITAMTGHAAPAVTRNYTEGALYKLTGIAPATISAAVGTVLPATASATLTNVGNGVTRVTMDPATAFSFARTTPAVPFDADIAITLGALTESDGVNVLTPARFGEASAGNGVEFTGGARSVRFGRLVVDNAHGAENLPLAVPLRAEFWNGGFQRNTDDNCTALGVGDLSVATTTLSLVTPPALASLGNGAWTLTLAQNPPPAPGAATVTAVLGASFPWLQTDDADADTLYNNDPIGLATFGLSNDQDRRIFQREVVGQ